MDPDFVVQGKFTIFWLNGGLKVDLDLDAPDFPKSISKYLCCKQVVRTHGFKCFTSMCGVWMQ